MERHLILEAFKATTSAVGQKEASEFLSRNSSMIGFVVLLADIVSDESLEMAIRQAAAIYLKNTVKNQWSLEPEDVGKLTPISEQDKTTVRQVIVGKVIVAPEPIKVHLCTCIQLILRHDFPEVWPGIVNELINLFSSNDGAAWYAGLLITHRLAKIFEFKRQVDKGPFLTTMSKLLPMFYERFMSIVDDQSQEANVIQKLILKIFYCYVQFSLSTEIMSAESFGLWLGMFVKVVERDIPAGVETIPIEEREETIWWKCKKWALKIIERVFERYGSKGHVDQIYQEFAEYYTNNYMSPVITSVMRVLERYVNKEYVTDRVLYLSLCHVSDALSHGTIWKMVKPHVEMIFSNILFPLMMFTEADEELWQDDPEAYLREKQDCFDEIRNPAAAAIRFIHAAARRKGILQPILVQVMGKLDNVDSSDPHELDGALHVVASLASILAEDRRYKKDVEKLLDVQVKPRIVHPVNYVRARALTVVRQAAEAPFHNRMFLSDLIETIAQRLKDPNEELPVKFEAAIAIQALISNQGDNISSFIRPRIGDLISEVLRLLGKHNLEDLPTVIETLIENYQDDVIPVAEVVVRELVQVFRNLSRSEDGAATDDNTMTIMGILGTLETILCLIDEKPEILKNVEPLVVVLIVDILESFASDYFEECSSLIDCLITCNVSPSMWVVYEKLTDTFDTEGGIFFSDMMPALYKFVTTDTPTFLSDPNRPMRMLLLCEKVFNDDDCGEDIQMYAVKMLEVLLSSCKGQLDAYFSQIVTLVMKKFLALDQTTFEDIHAQCAITLLACFIYNDNVFLQLFTQFGPQHANNLNWLYEYVFNHFNSFQGIHDRAVLLYALFMAFKMDPRSRPNMINTDHQKLMEVIMKLFADIQKCRRLIAQQNEDDSDSDSDDDEDDRDNDLHDSDDDINEHDQEYLSSLEQKIADASEDGDDEDHHDFVECTELEEFETAFDGETPALNVHVIFMEVMKDLENSDPTLYHSLLNLPEERKPDLAELIKLCNQEKEHILSKQLNNSGGYNFNTNGEVPNQFSFN